MADRFWVGGSGNFSDTAHWSTFSGGAGGASVPGLSDRAIWDSSSGTGTCTLDQNVAVDDFEIRSSGNIDIDTTVSNYSITSNTDVEIRSENNGHNFRASAINIGRDFQFRLMPNSTFGTSTITLTGTGQVRAGTNAVALYNLIVDGTGAGHRFDNQDSNTTWVINNDFTVSTDFTCIDPDAADLANLTIGGALIVNASATFEASPSIDMDVTGDIDIYGTFSGALSMIVDCNDFTVLSTGDFNSGSASIWNISGSCVVDSSSTVDFNDTTVTLDGTGNLALPTENHDVYDLIIATGADITLTADAYVNGFGASLEIQTGASVEFGSNSLIFREGLTGGASIHQGATYTASGNGRLQIQPNGAVTVPVTLAGTGTVDLSQVDFLIREWGASSGTVQLTGTADLECDFLQVGALASQPVGERITLDMNGRSVTCEDCQIGRTAGDSEASILMGSGTLNVTRDLELRDATGGRSPNVLNFESGTYLCGRNLTVSGSGSIVGGTGTINFNGGSGTQTVTLAGEKLPTVEVTNVVGTIAFADAMDCSTFMPGNGSFDVNITFLAGVTHNWDTYDSTNASGSGRIILNSNTGSSAWNLTLGSNQTALRTDVTYSNLTGFTMDATDVTNDDGGNNSANWQFAAPPTPSEGSSQDRRGINTGILIGT